MKLETIPVYFDLIVGHIVAFSFCFQISFSLNVFVHFVHCYGAFIYFYICFSAQEDVNGVQACNCSAHLAAMLHSIATC